MYSPLDSKDIKRGNPKEINPEYSLEGLMLKLKLQYFGPWYKELTHLKIPWCWERLKVGGEGDVRGWDGWMALPTQWTWVWASPGSWWWTGKPGVLQSMGLQIVGHDWVTELNWPSSPQLLATAILLYEFDYSKYPYKWNYTAFVFLWLAYFTLQRVLRVHPCCSIYQNFLHF